MSDKTVMELRIEYVQELLDDGYTRIEAVEKLQTFIPKGSSTSGLKFNSAKIIVYTAFPGPTYAQRKRRWKKKPVDNNELKS